MKQEEQWKPKFHFTAPKGWINDPNGLVWFKGVYHIFYQYNPYGCNWDSMHWGHGVSDDLIHWKDVGCALWPDREYDMHPEGGCFSGCPVVFREKLYLFYTASVKLEGKTMQTQCVAISEDGYFFKKHERNPLIKAPEGNSEDFRDPKVFWAEGKWRLICGGSTGAADDRESIGRIYMYSSDDLIAWRYNGILLDSEGRWGSMFECPDLFQLNGKWFLTTSPMNHPDFWPGICFVGEMDFSECRFQVEQIVRYDWGRHFYAPQSYLLPDGRRIALAWMNGWMWMPWMENWGPTEKEGWRGCLTLPRELSVNEDLWLCAKPIREVECCLKEEKRNGKGMIGKEKMELPVGIYNAYRLQIEIEEDWKGQLQISFLSDGAGKEAVLTIDLQTGILVLDKERMGNHWDSGMVFCDFRLSEEKTGNSKFALDLWVDRSAIELFVNGGRETLTETLYPSQEQYRLFIRTPYKQVKLDWRISPYSSITWISR